MDKRLVEWFEGIDNKKVRCLADDKTYTPVHIYHDGRQYDIVCFNEAGDLEFVPFIAYGNWHVLDEEEGGEPDECDHEWLDVGFMHPTYVCRYCDKEK